MSAPERSVLPLLPLRDIVVFPEMVVPLFVGRDKSLEAIEAALRADKRLVVAAQKDPQLSTPAPEDIYDVGTLTTILQVVRLPDGMMKLLVEGVERMKILGFAASEPSFSVYAEPYQIRRGTRAPRVGRARQALLDAVERYAQLSKKISKEAQAAIAQVEDPGRLSDLVATHLELDIGDRQFLLEIADVGLRLEEMLRLVQAELETLEVEQRIQQRVKEQMERNQREYYLNEQIKAIHNELGTGDDARQELDELKAKIDKKALPPHVRERAEGEWKKLKLMQPAAAEATVVRNYLDWILAVPWLDEKPLAIDVAHVRLVLDEDHYGLDKVKERIVEYLAVRKLSADVKGPKLCLVGPPGVGKTSLAKSIARALGLDFVRQSLGGVRDEAEIRGHRRTYIGALPGRVVQGLRKVTSRNPVFLLDEIDKLANDFRGDPASALLEVLDPEQNDTFLDHYLDLELDLSRVLFVTTANTLDAIPAPLRDRLEIIVIGSYTEEEKIEIARRHLVPKQLMRHGLSAEHVTLADEALRKIVREYTREAGVRELERQIEAVCRKAAVQTVAAGDAPAPDIAVTDRTLRGLLGSERFRRDESRPSPQVGVTQGLAWTEVGGQVLVTEVTVVPGQGRLEITGKLGEVMQESVRAAMSYVRSRSERLGIDPDFHRQVDTHVHVPEGAVPKDGPSAGITLATSLVSALTGIPVRTDLAMTGEITLRGRVLPVGGLKEKILAAHRVGIGEVLVPVDTEHQLDEIPDKVRKEIAITPVSDMDQVLERALKHEGAEGLFAFLSARGLRLPVPRRPPEPPPTPVN